MLLVLVVMLVAPMSRKVEAQNDVTILSVNETLTTPDKLSRLCTRVLTTLYCMLRDLYTYNKQYPLKCKKHKHKYKHSALALQLRY